MSEERTHKIRLASSSRIGATKQLTALAKRYTSALESTAAGYTVTSVAPVSEDDDDWTLKVTLRDSSNNGANVEFWWKKETPNEGVIEVTTHQAIADKVRVGVTAILVLGFMFFADQSSELLPVLRGLRVAVGAILGLVIGFPLAGILGAIVGRKSEAGVQAAAALAHTKLLELSAGREVAEPTSEPSGGEVAA